MPPSSSDRQYPLRPVVGVGAVVLDAADAIVLVKRRYAPFASRWSLPGGSVELGETLEQALVREVREETGLDVDVVACVEVLDRIQRDASGRVEYHYVLVDYVCRRTGGVLHPGSDAADAVSIPRGELDAYGLTPETLAVIDRAVEQHRRAPGGAMP